MEEKIIGRLLKAGIIKDEEAAIYQYGFGLLVKKIIHAGIILMIGLAGGEFWGVFFFLATYIAIREYSGGYHAKSSIGCYCCTAFVTVCLLALLKLFQMANSIWFVPILLICGGFIWFLSPQEAHNKPLSSEEKVMYQKLSRKYVLVFGGISLLGALYMDIVKGIACAWLIQSVMLLIGMSGSRSK